MRLHPSHPKRKEICEQLNKIEAGFAGEQLVDRNNLEVGFPKDLYISEIGLGFSEIRFGFPEFSFRKKPLARTMLEAFND